MSGGGATTCFQEVRHRTSGSLDSSLSEKMIPLFSRRPMLMPVSRRWSPLQVVFILLITITFVFICYSSLSLSPLLHFLDPYSYVLVLDAGSTGTRLHVYKFEATSDLNHVDTFILKNEIFEELKPGLSSFADNVHAAELQIDELLKIADRQVTRFKHRATPLVLRATAGLRLLNETKQKDLLNGVSSMFGKYGFYRPKMDIAIMNETEEGIDAWLTLVYLKGEQFYSSRIAALDLGGGSTQITYNPALSNTSLAAKLNLLLSAQQPVQPGQIHAFRDPTNEDKKRMPKIDVAQAGLEEIQPAKVIKAQELAVDGPKDEAISEEAQIMRYMHQFSMFRRDIRLYSRSYLGYGLMIARQLIFLNETTTYKPLKTRELKSRCMPTGLVGKFKFQEITWTVDSAEGVSPDDRFYACLSSIDGHISSSVQPAIGLDQMLIYVFSYFYDTVADAGLLADSEDPSQVTRIQIRALKQAARSICRGSNTTNKHPFLCFDLAYIYSLLTKGYGLQEESHVHVCKKIQQFEVAWSLGLALKLL